MLTFSGVVLYVLIIVFNTTQANPGVPIPVTGERGGSAVIPCLLQGLHKDISSISLKKTDTIARFSFSPKDVAVRDAYRARVKLDGTNVTIASLVISDEGSYTCIVTMTGVLDDTETLIVLTVTAAPDVSASVVTSPRIDSDGTYVAATCYANAGKPKAKIQWTNQRGEVQQSRDSTTLAEDKSANVESHLLLKPGLLRHNGNVTSLPIVDEDKTQTFACHVVHRNLPNPKYNTRQVDVNLLYSPMARISLIANQLTCVAEGNPPPSLTWLLPNGDILQNQPSVYVDQRSTGIGRYVCRASSDLKPDGFSTLIVQKAKDLPTLFRTLNHVDISLPTTASGYQIQCSVEVDSPPDDANFYSRMYFRWSKNGRFITNGLYNISSSMERIEAKGVRLNSTLIFPNVVRDRDDATFECRLVNTSLATGFITAVERSVRISVDYAPESAKIFMDFPKDGFVAEGEPLRLICSAHSKPSSIYEWYFREKKISSGQNLVIQRINRTDAGEYRCIAYNYVPGSSQDSMTVEVHYPPTKVFVVLGSSGNHLKCIADSVPPPIFTWILPNRTRLFGSSSLLKLSSMAVDRPLTYECHVHNNLGKTAKTSYVLLPPKEARIGALAVNHFIVVVVMGVVIAIVLAAILVVIANRRQKMRKCARMTADESRFNKSTIRDVRYADCKSPAGCVESITTSTQKTPGSCLRTSRDPNFTRSPSKQFQSSSEVDGSSIEIVENESLETTGDNSGHTAKGPKKNEQNVQSVPLASPGKATSPAKNMTLSNYNDVGRGSTLPCPARLASIRRDMARHMQEQAILQFATHTSLPHMPPGKPPIPPQAPVGMVYTGYSGILYDDTYRPGIPNYVCAESVIPHCRAPPAIQSMRKEAISASTVNSEDFLHGGRSTRPRSMSLSASCSSDGSTSLESSRQKNPASKEEEEGNMEDSGRTISPFDSGNGSAKSVYASVTSKKQQSLTLV
ncbi:unnamed protein product [Clavelina lepadiformis]|uniref:Ig-like domain-containing protein n=1 Tax=Clavelina lepadiformis TaxID=159417 RepID=A0ABP0FE24_CLALP